MTFENPFPGMNPYLERSWADVHGYLLNGTRDALSEQLPLDLKVRTEEQVAIDGPEERRLRADIAVKESWKEGIAPAWRPPSGPSDVIVAEPEVILVEDEVPPRWLEITDRDGRLITVIEILSPSNKSAHREEYLERQGAYLESAVNLVEVDLLRGGRHSVAVNEDQLRPQSGTRYLACVCRAIRPLHREVYPMPLRERLPAFRIPLRPGDADVVLDLQPLVDRCYRTGRYWLTDFRGPLTPPFSPEEAAWVEERLRGAGLI